MSVNSKMTAIADKIRSLLGLTGAMGLDAMAANLEVEQTNLSNAFAAIGVKGGTLPDSRISGNLESAIGSIPDYVPVRRAEGAVTINNDENRNTYVNCGFTPDIVLIKDLVYTSANGVETGYQLTAFLAERTSGLNYMSDGYTGTEQNGWKHYYTEIYPTDQGFRLYNLYYYDQSNVYHAGAGEVLNYIAVKYTA